jgi:hypothetical protein
MTRAFVVLFIVVLAVAAAALPLPVDLLARIAAQNITVVTGRATVKLWIPAARCDNATATSPEWSFPTSNPGAPACVTGSNTQFGVMDFADGANTLSAQWHMKLPSDWTSTIDVSLRWFTTATSGNVVWQVSTICVADAETSDPAFNTASTVTDAAKGTTVQQNDASITTLTVTGCAAGELMYVRVFRDPTNGSDTLAATARLVGLELTYRRLLAA